MQISSVTLFFCASCSYGIGSWSAVNCLLGGFLEFQATHPSLCQSQSVCSTSMASGYKCPPLTSMSQPCLPVSNIGPTKILPFLFLGSQQDALSQETMQVSQSPGLILLNKVSKVYYSTWSIVVCSQLHHYANSHAIWDYTLLPATQQRWHSPRLYSFQSWYSI